MALKTWRGFLAYFLALPYPLNNLFSIFRKGLDFWKNSWAENSESLWLAFSRITQAVKGRITFHTSHFFWDKHFFENSPNYFYLKAKSPYLLRIGF